MFVDVPAQWATGRPRALVVVLHGGMGSAERILGQGAEHALDINAVAERDGFMVAYLNGSHAARALPEGFLAWNSGGGCCGLPYQSQVDDVGYIERAVAALIGRYGIDPARVYAMGHSNGAMMSQRMICNSKVFAAAVAVSGPLAATSTRCPDASGRRVLAIHGANDANVPINGGVGERGISRVAFPSEQSSKDTMVGSGASYDLQILPGVDHALSHIEASIEANEHRTLGEKAAQFFGVSPASSSDTRNP
jgi:poly(3-hydroxybutyrate) depolymerase